MVLFLAVGMGSVPQGPHRGGRSSPAGSGDDGDAGEPVLAAVRQQKACTPAAKVVSGTKADMMFRC